MGRLERTRGALLVRSMAAFSAACVGAPLGTAEHVHGVPLSLAEELSCLFAVGLVSLCVG